MELTHLCLFVARKDTIGYSLPGSLYHAAEEGSVVRTYLTREDVLSTLRVLAAQPHSYADVQKDLDCQLLYDQKISFAYMKELRLVGSAHVRRHFEHHLGLTLHELYYGSSCYGDGNCVLSFHFSKEESATVKNYFYECVDFHLWLDGQSDYLGYFPYQVIKQLLGSERCLRYVLRIFEAYEGGEIKDDGGIFEIFEMKPYKCSRLLEVVETKHQFDLSLASDYKENVQREELYAKAALFYNDLCWINVSSAEEESEWRACPYSSESGEEGRGEGCGESTEGEESE